MLNRRDFIKMSAIGSAAIIAGGASALATLLSKPDVTLTGLNTGFASLDSYIGGFQRSELIILGGRPGMGKTALALTLAANIAAGNNGQVAFFSLEMSRDRLVQRLFSSVGRVELSKIRKNSLNDADRKKLFDCTEIIREKKLFIDDTSTIATDDLCSRVRFRHHALQGQGGLGLVVVDYLQLMRASHSANSREQEISEISRVLKGLAKELDIPIIALSQLNRQLEQRPRHDKRPVLSDLAQSGVIEPYADLVIFLYRDSVYGKNEVMAEVEEAEIIISKHRDRQTGTIKMQYAPAFTLFAENSTA